MLYRINFMNAFIKYQNNLSKYGYETPNTNSPIANPCTSKTIINNIYELTLDSVNRIVFLKEPVVE